ncbi:NADP oxidoreductase coenzyme F420-dependent/Pyrroline-5-carboxylate reductase dimerisation, putative [Angomonas deanei]|uniref:Pyrroline-5-carboxylate reductase n=1 Tax=Angomonas deanei TaxID=59799 RepID=A0A7G2CN84_9TRYP|nr:NADP oxidoreductase coenzyme F420-dependent/Pyrroline-5-carboxylate reductase dimerisation, putative [Angomonas deanei]
MSTKVGFLGCGSMAECIMSGALKNGALTPENTFVCNRTVSTMERLVKDYGVQKATADELAKTCDIVILGVKPYGVLDMCKTISKDITPKTLVVSVAAGITIASMEKNLPEGTKVIRVMPNVPSLVGCGMSSVSPNASVKEDELNTVMDLLKAVGRVEIVQESLIHGVIGACGSSPAYVFVFLEAMCDGAVRGGLPRSQARELCAQAVLGAAKMMQETGKSPAELKDMVCSPGGTTIEAVRVFWRGAVSEVPSLRL